jgi:uncharacterized protein with FMN-binding domain
MLPRRAVVAIATTAIALVLLLNFKTPSAPILGSTPLAVGQPSSQAALAPTAAAGSSAGTGTAPAASSSPVQSSTQGRATSLKNGQYSGPVEQIPFGNVQVQVTIQGGKIVDVQALQLPTAHARSQQIGQYAAPILRQEALQAQSAQINLVSGATYTSEAYAQSLQGALDQATA